jgi:hypothetical protein
VAPFAARAGLGRDRLLEAVGQRLGRFFGKRGGSVVQANLELIGAAWDGLIDVTAAITATTAAGATPSTDAAATPPAASTEEPAVVAGGVPA